MIESENINAKKAKRFREIANELADLYSKKNRNYGDSFGQLYRDLGPISGLVPLHNKLDRITNLIKGDSNYFESIEDNLRDLANYAIMNLIEMEYAKKNSPKSNQTGWWNNPVGTADTTMGVISSGASLDTKMVDLDAYKEYFNFDLLDEMGALRSRADDEGDVEYSNEH